MALQPMHDSSNCCQLAGRQRGRLVGCEQPGFKALVWGSGGPGGSQHKVHKPCSVRSLPHVILAWLSHSSTLLIASLS